MIGIKDMTQEDVTMKNYTTREVYAALGVTEAQFYAYRKRGIFQVDGIREGNSKIYSYATLELFQQELKSLQEQDVKEQPIQQEQQIVFTSPPLTSEASIVETKEVSLPLHSLDPIEQAINLLQQSKQQGFERQQMVQDVRAMREQLGILQKAMDDFLERYDS